MNHSQSRRHGLTPLRALLICAAILSACAEGSIDGTNPENQAPEEDSSPATPTPEPPEDQASPVDDIRSPQNGLSINEYIVVLHQNAPYYQTINGLGALGIVASKAFHVIPSFVATLNPAQIAALKSNPSVRYIERNQTVQASAVQTGPRFGLDRIDQPLGTNGTYNDYGFDGAGTHIYIVDTGIRSTHQEFTGRMGNWFSAFGGTAEDCHGHGTHVASSAAGTLYGVAKQATLHGVRVLDCNGGGTVASVIAGLEWIGDNFTMPAVANLSLGGGASQALDDAVSALVDAGVVVVAAAGNDNGNACQVSPARAPRALTVGATDEADKRASFSNYGNCVDIFAPGTNVIGAHSSSNTATASMSGTSMAAPHVAGVAALYLDRYPFLPPDEVTKSVISKATPNVVKDPVGSPNRFVFNNLGTPNPQSCYGFCGSGPLSNCFCDEYCGHFGDCCADYQSACF